MRACAASETGPVTVIFNRRVRAGRQQEYESQLKLLLKQMQQVPGYLNADVVPDSASRQYTSIVHFDSLSNLRAWQASGQRERWQRGLADVVEGDATVKRAEGLEFWFEAPHAAVKAPSRHKMALLLVLLVTAISFVLAPLLTHYLAAAPRLFRVFILATVQITLLTYVIMPRVTRALAFWLYEDSTPQATQPRST